MAELIDREELRERIYERFGRHSTKVIATVEEGRIMSDWAFLEPFLNAAKTVDAEPVRHGRWISIVYDSYADGAPVWDKWECSECYHEHNGEEDTLTDFCPDCGARMDGDVP